VTITTEIKGGYRVDMGGLTAFMPRSEADPNPKATSGLVGTRCECAILDVSRRPDNIVVSRKQPLLAIQAVQRGVFFEQTKVGSRVNGTVRRLADFGAFVDLGGVDALLHVSDISWRRIEHPSEMLTVNQQVTVEVLKLDAETGKVSVSIKSMQDDPWTHVEQTYEENMRVTGTVLKLLDFGAVVELEPGIEGLIHRSEMSWMRKDVKPTEVLTEGDVVDVAILEVKPKARRIRLSLKEVADNPWESWLAEHPVGSRITGKVRNMTDFGFFVGLGNQMDGLVHLANISWTERGEVAMEHFHKGQEVEAVVLGVDVERQRISLGVKQASEDPFEVFVRNAKRGAVVKGTITENVGGAYLVALADGLRARLGMREMPRDSDELNIGEVIDAKIIDVNRRRRQVELSVRQYLRDEERDAVRQYSQQTAAEENLSPLAIELQKKFLSINK
ncbi:MAG: S1 RNA-binding domain-containing protein, partial [Mariprofundaceae bacterium]|nr:S1 RNA-binding domain-containing protein [Mariprofundaceae bacterium]